MDGSMDFIGMAWEDVKEILASGYPEIRYSVVLYRSPKKNDTYSFDGWPGSTCRVIRQRVTDGNRLEFTVSPFQNG